MSRVSTASSKPKVSLPSSSAKRTASKRKSDYSSKIPDGADRYQMVATAAYFRAEHRGFVGGDPVQDWLAAESEISRLYH